MTRTGSVSSKRIGDARAKTDWQVHVLCLMVNPFHLAVETPNGNLGAYTGRVNRRHKVFGHLFSGRYKALVVDPAAPGSSALFAI